MRTPAAAVILALSLCLIPQAWGHGDKTHEKAATPKTDHHWAAPPAEQERINPVPRSDASVLRGETLFQKDCADCHGIHADGKGPDAQGMVPKPTNLKAMAGHHTDGDLFWKIQKGKGPMPGWEGTLSREEIWDLVNFIQDLKPSH